jgi:hypothetical protein
MKRALPEADVRGCEQRISSLTLPDADDRHILAAAIEAGAQTISTFHLRHFPAQVLAPFGFNARDPDAFLCDLYETDREGVRAVFDAAPLNLSRAAPSAGSFIDALERQRLVGLAARLRSR